MNRVDGSNQSIASRKSRSCGRQYSQPRAFAPQRWVLAGALLVGPLVGATGASAADVDTIRVLPSQAGPDETLTLVLEGTWPRNCPPTFLRHVELEGHEFTLLVSASAENPPPINCPAVPTPYRVAHPLPAVGTTGSFDLEVLWIDTPFIPTLIAQTSFEIGEGAGLTVEVSPGVGESHPGTALAYGIWPVGCAPSLLGVMASEPQFREVYLVTESLRSRCGDELAPFALAADLPWLNSGSMYEIQWIVQEREDEEDVDVDLFQRASNWFDVSTAETRPLLQGERFQVSVLYNTDQVPQSARLAPGSTDETALFYFFDPDNLEVQVKVLDGCGLNQRYWVFAAASTDQAYTIRVDDLVANQSRSYTNAGGNAAVAINDTDAFATCP